MKRKAGIKLDDMKETNARKEQKEQKEQKETKARNERNAREGSGRLAAWGGRFRPRHVVLLGLLLGVILAQHLPSWGEAYARHLYPWMGRCLSAVSQQVPFALGDAFIGLSLLGLVLVPGYLKGVKHCPFRQWFPGWVEYLVWVYVWFYLAWGLNYAQASFYQRTGIVPVAASDSLFHRFADTYVERLNASYTEEVLINRDVLRREVVKGYRALSPSLGIHAPFQARPRVKTMLFSSLASKVGVSGSMGPFFTEFTVNADVPSRQFPSTYAHELSHWLGIASEAEANFYAYQVCTRSRVPAIRYSGYLALLPHVLSNARGWLDEADYRVLVSRIRPEILAHYEQHRMHWQSLYSPLLGRMQDALYDWYLRGNRIPGGLRNYSQVIGLLISYESVQALR